MKIINLIILGIVFVLLFTGCNSQYIYYKVDDEIKTAMTDSKTPPKTALKTNIRIDLKDWRLLSMSASPKNTYLALALIDRQSGTNLDARLDIYTNKGGYLYYSFTGEDLQSLIENALDYTYPNFTYAFFPFELGYENDNVLIARIEPEGSGIVAQTVIIKIDLRTKKLIEKPIFLSRHNQYIYPTHTSKNKYNFTVIKGKMYINGEKLKGMPNNIDEKLHDEVEL